MDIDYGRIESIIARFSAMSGYEAYYLREEARYERVAPLVPDTSHVLRKAFSVSKQVLDVGCGWGRTLLDHAHLFHWGAGFDESGEHMIVPAIRDRDARGIRNVEFFIGKARQLLFDDSTFDLVFSERGPLGHSDVTLQEALRVLRPTGMIFVETGGTFSTLGVEKERFERQGVRIATLACRTVTFTFPDYYNLLVYQVAGWGWDVASFKGEEGRERLDKAFAAATQPDGTLAVEQNTIWVAGTKG